MPMIASDIEALLRDAFPDAVIAVEDIVGDGDHWSASVESSAFAGRSRVQQHQMVYAALKGRVGGDLHALALQTSLPK